MTNCEDQFAEAARFWDEGKLQEAMAVYQKLLRDEAIPAMARAVLCEYLGRLQVGLGDLATAEEFLRRAITLDPEGVDHHVQLANCLCLCERQEEAWELMQKLHQRHPDHPTVIHYVGKMLDERGQHQKGLALMKKAVHLDPNNERMLADLALSYLMHGNPGAAMVCSEQALELNAEDEVVRFVHDLASEFENSARARKSSAQNRAARRKRNTTKSRAKDLKRNVP